MLHSLSRRPSALALALLTLAAAPPALLAQTTGAAAARSASPTAAVAAPPFGRVDGRGITPGTWTYGTTVTRNGQSQQTTRTLAVSPTTAKGAPAWLVVDMQQSGQSALYDSLTLAQADMRPLYHVWRLGPMRTEFTYAKDSVSGSATLPQGATKLAAPFVRGSMVSSSMLEMHLRVLPLRVGWRGQTVMSAVTPQGTVSMPVTVTVTGEERVSVPAGTLDTWVVTIRNQTGEQTAWVGKVKHEIVKVRATMGDGTIETVLMPGGATAAPKR